MTLTNETRHIKWHEKCTRECRLDVIACNNKQRWNKINVDVNVKD